MRSCALVGLFVLGCSSPPTTQINTPTRPPAIDPDDPNAPCRHKASCAVVEVPEQTFEQATAAFDIDCDPAPGRPDLTFGPTHSFDFTLSDQAQSFLIVPFVRTGELQFLGIDTPRGALDGVLDYRYHNRLAGVDATGATGTYGEIAMDWSVLVPYAPKYERYVVPGGEYTVRVASEVKPCMYVVEQKVAAPTRLDVNFYFVGVDGLTASTAPTHPDFQAVLDRFERIYGKLDVSLGQVRYFDIDGEAARRFRVIRDREEIHELMSLGVSPGSSLEENLSIDVFLVADITSDGGTVGVSGGIPGAAGMHGNATNGLVFSALDLGWYDNTMGHVMAHEVGHFLGLRHTTELYKGLEEAESLQEDLEQLLGLGDPIEDSPECESPSKLMSQCPDHDNLMYPVVPFRRIDPKLTPGQRATLSKNPLLQR